MCGKALSHWMEAEEEESRLPEVRQWPGRLKLRSCYFSLTIVAAGLTANGNVPRFQVRKTILGSKRGNSYIIFASNSRLLLARMVLGPQQQQHSVI